MSSSETTTGDIVNGVDHRQSNTDELEVVQDARRDVQFCMQLMRYLYGIFARSTMLLWGVETNQAEYVAGVVATFGEVHAPIADEVVALLEGIVRWPCYPIQWIGMVQNSPEYSRRRLVELLCEKRYGKCRSKLLVYREAFLDFRNWLA